MLTNPFTGITINMVSANDILKDPSLKQKLKKPVFKTTGVFRSRMPKDLSGQVRKRNKSMTSSQLKKHYANIG